MTESANQNEVIKACQSLNPKSASFKAWVLYRSSLTYLQRNRVTFYHETFLISSTVIPA